MDLVFDMDIITTSLEALIQRATNVHNQGPDTAAIDAFCGLINKEPECTHVASKFIIAKAHSLKEWEALQALLLLENCMNKCGVMFHSEVGKFRFLNELIKLVSPKYLGAHTPDSVKRRVLELMASWSTAFPNQSKIKEAYVMLKKQGVVQDEVVPPQQPSSTSTPSSQQVEPKERTSSIFQDEEKSLLLQKLLRSSNPVDLQAANRLIKTMVKEDEKRVEEKWRRRIELETVVNNCSLLREMLSSYENGSSSLQDIELINELHTTCTNLRPVLIRLANNPDPSFTCDVLSANDELGDVLTKYKEVMSSGVRPSVQQSSLLDLTSPDQPSIPSNTPNTRVPEVSLLEENANSNPSVISESQGASLDDILGLVPSPSTDIPVISTIPQSSHNINKNVENMPPAKPKGLEELDLLGENLLKEILSKSGQQQSSKRTHNKLSMNDLLNGSSLNGDSGIGSANGVVTSSESEVSSGRSKHDVPGDSTSVPVTSGPQSPGASSQLSELSKNDEPLLSLGDVDSALDSLSLNENSTTSQINSLANDSHPPQSESQTATLPVVASPSSDSTECLSDDVNLLGSPGASQHSDSSFTSLSDVNVSLDNIKPSGVAPWVALSDSEGVSILVTLTSARPKPDVAVFVVTTTSKSKHQLQDLDLRPVVPRTCKARLMSPSATCLPAFNPFLPPSAIVQILLVTSQSKDPITLKLIVSYNIEGETVTDIGQVNDLQLSE